MGLFKANKAENVEAPKDTLGGFTPITSGVYKAVIEMAYSMQVASGAQKLVLELNLPDLGRKLTQNIFVVSKTGAVTYEKNGQNYYLPGYLVADSIALIATDGEAGIMDDLETASKVVKIYDSKTKSEVNTKVDTITEIMGKTIQVGLLTTRKNKQALIGNDWQDTEEEQTITEISAVFDEDGFTALELEAEATEPVFIDEWKSAWDGKLRDNYKEVKAAGRGATTTASESGAPQRTSRRQMLRGQ